MSISRKDIYSYVASLFTSITKNIYRISVPETLGSDAISNGFIVLNMGEVEDFSQFSENTFVQTRIYVECYVPSTNTVTANGVMNTTKYDDLQKAIDTIIEAESKKTNQKYSISEDYILSTDDFFTNKTNSFFVYIKSFIVITN